MTARGRYDVTTKLINDHQIRVYVILLCKTLCLYKTTVKAIMSLPEGYCSSYPAVSESMHPCPIDHHRFFACTIYFERVDFLLI